MPRIEFPPGYVENTNLPRTRRSLTNNFNDGKVIVATPGITTITAATGGVARGQFVWNGAIYQIISEDLFKFSDITTGVKASIGTIAGAALVRVAIGFTEAVLVVQGGAIYTLDTSDTLTTISGNANFEACDELTFINNRFVYIPTNGANPAFFSDVGAAGTVQASSFFDAEELPDKNTTVFNLRNTLYIGGTDSFELYRDTGADPVPFQRISGARIDYGYIGGLIAYGDTYYFIGREKDQDFGIYAISQSKAEKVSNEGIDLVLAKHTIAQMEVAVASRFKWRGYDMFTITLALDSFGFYNGFWHFLSRRVGTTDSPWGGGFITQFEGTYYSAFENKVGKLDEVNTDYGAAIPRIIDTAFEQAENEFFACQSISMGIGQGENADVGTVGLAVTRNNVEYGPMLFRDLGALGEYTQHLTWNPPGGLGTYNGFLGIRIYTTQNVDFNANSLVAFFRG